MANWAIVIGVNQYRNNNLHSLQYAKDDATAMANFFKSELGFEQVFLFTEQADSINIGGIELRLRPTHETLKFFFHRQFQALSHVDNLWFFFAGHGQRRNDMDYLMLLDSDSQELEDTALSVDFVVHQLQRTRADNVVLFLDACRDKGNGGARGVGKNYPDIVTFYSCQPNERSWEIGDPINQGSFTHVLLDALRIHRCNSLDHLYNYLHNEVLRLNTEYGREPQNPVLAIESQQDLAKRSSPILPSTIDIEALKNEALKAELDRDWPRALRLWKRVDRVTGGQDSDAHEVLERLIRIINSPFNRLCRAVRRVLRFLPIGERFILFLTIVGITALMIIILKPNPPSLTHSPSPTGGFITGDSISSGEESLVNSSTFNGQYNSDKRAGISAFKSQDFNTAFNKFQGILKNAEDVLINSKSSEPDRNAAKIVLQDPELRIFANNSEVRDRAKDNPKLLYTIAVATPVQNPYGIEILRGVAQQQSEAIKKGLNLQVVIADDSSDENQGHSKARADAVSEAIAKNSSILAVVGHYSSGVTCHVLPKYNQAKLVVISPTSSMNNLREECSGNPPQNSIFFRVVSSTVTEAKVLANYAIDKTVAPQVAVFYNPNEPYSKSMFKEFKKALRNKAKIDEVAMGSNFSASQYSQEIEHDDVIAIFPDGKVDDDTVFNRVIDVLNAVPNKPEQPILAGNAFYLMESLKKIRGKNLDGRLVVATPWHRDVPQASKFNQDAGNYWHGDVNYRTALAYEATHILANLLEDKQDTREKIQQKLSTKDWEIDSVIFEGRTVKFQDNGDPEYGQQDRVLVTPDTSSGDSQKFQLLSDYEKKHPKLQGLNSQKPKSP